MAKFIEFPCVEGDDTSALIAIDAIEWVSLNPKSNTVSIILKCRGADIYRTFNNLEDAGEAYYFLRDNLLDDSVVQDAAKVAEESYWNDFLDKSIGANDKECQDIVNDSERRLQKIKNLLKEIYETDSE